MSQIRIATPGDAASLLEIYSAVVLETAGSFEQEPPSLEEMATRVERTLASHPWLVWEEEERVYAYAYATAFRPRAAYQWSAEVSAYVHEDRRGRGIAGELYKSLFEILASQGFVSLFAGIALPNPASISLHEKFGFQRVGVLRKVGFKLGDWHDVGWWQLSLGIPPSSPRPPLLFGEMKL